VIACSPEIALERATLLSWYALLYLVACIRTCPYPDGKSCNTSMGLN
jgi:hypothetical protein